MTRKQLAVAAVVVLVLAAAALLFMRGQGNEEPDPEDTGATESTAEPAESLAVEEIRPAELYFPGGAGGLHPERHDLPVKSSVEDRIAVLVEALIAGPADNRLQAPLPPDIEVRKVYLVDGGPSQDASSDPAANPQAGGRATVFLDLASPEGAPPPASGSQREMLTVFSLVNTVLLNVEGAGHVVLLWNGEQPTTFAGHLNTARPLAANQALIADAL